MELRISGVENFVGEEERDEFLSKLEGLFTAVPEIDWAHLFLERSVHGWAMCGVQGLVFGFHYGLYLVLSQDEQGWWGLSELCPSCLEVRTNEAEPVCGQEECSHVWPEGCGTFRFRDLLPAHYDENPFSSHVKNSKEQFERLGEEFALRLEFVGVPVLEAQLFGRTTSLALRDCVTAWSRPNRIGFAWGAAPA